MASDDPDAELSRRELERIAFSRPGTPDEAAAAQAAQRKLAAQSPTPRQPTVPEPVEGPPPSTFDYDEDLPTPAKPIRRTLIPLLVIIGLGLGLTGGILVAHVSPSILSAAPSATPTAKPTRSPGPLPDATRALAELSSPQLPTDVFPIPAFGKSLNLEKTSIHRILTTEDNVTLWIGRSPQDICMMYTGGEGPYEPDAAASCASIFEFGDSGLTLHFDRDTWTWDGTSFTTTVAY